MTSAFSLEKQRRRVEQEAELGARQLALPNKRYGVILADPGWHFEPYSRETGTSRAADNRYVTEPTNRIEAPCARRLGCMGARSAMNGHKIIGIDIGLAGAIAVLDAKGILETIYDMPTLADG